MYFSARITGLALGFLWFCVLSPRCQVLHELCFCSCLVKWSTDRIRWPFSPFGRKQQHSSLELGSGGAPSEFTSYLLAAILASLKHATKRPSALSGGCYGTVNKLNTFMTLIGIHDQEYRSWCVKEMKKCCSFLKTNR